MKLMISKVSLLFLFVVFPLRAQQFEMGKVSVAELSERVHPKDSAAAAAYLFRKGTVDYVFQNGFTTVTTVKTRIKIYKKEGYGEANQIITYYSGDNSNVNIYITDAATYNLVDGKIEATKLKGEGEFVDRVNKYYTQKKFTMPNVKTGSVIEFTYVIKQLGIGTPTSWDFQYGIPVNYSEFVTSIPEYFEYNKNQRGFLFPKVTTTKVLDRTDYSITKTTYVLENAPAMKEESYMNSVKNYTSSISHELSKIGLPGYYQKSYADGWENITKTIYKINDFDNELSKTSYFEEDITNLTAGLATTKEKVSAVFNHVKSMVKWNGDYGIFCRYGVRDAYKNRTGNVAEINLMLTSMLRYAGVTASPVLISTRSNGVVLFPALNAFNYVICAVEANNEVVLLDATEKNATPNILPFRDLNFKGRIIRKEGNSSVDVDLVPTKLSREIVNVSAVLNKEGTITGKLRRQLTDHKALSFREKNLTLNQDNYLEDLESKYHSIEIDGYLQENADDPEKQMIETYSFSDKNDMELIGEKIYLTPQLFLTENKNPFKLETREYPVDFGYPFEEKYNINIEIPEGYTIETLPKPVSLITGEDNIGAFKYMIAGNGNKIQVTITTDINVAVVPADYYDVLKDFYQRMIEKLNEKIVLIKT